MAQNDPWLLVTQRISDPFTRVTGFHEPFFCSSCGDYFGLAWWRTSRSRPAEASVVLGPIAEHEFVSVPVYCPRCKRRFPEYGQVMQFFEEAAPKARRQTQVMPRVQTQPLLYEVNTRQWLAELGRQQGHDIDLYAVPESELDLLRSRGVTHLWLMGVWPTGPRSRNQALEHVDLRRAYDDALPGWNDDDVSGSPYAVGALQISPLIGGDGGLEHLRKRLHARGIKVILDFVPNHLGLDHAWVLSRPQIFVGSSTEIAGSFALSLPTGTRYLAHGKDPYFPGWTDTVQLDYRKSETRAAMRQMLRFISQKCDGVRCDMAMLMLSDVFEKTWAHVPAEGDLAKGEFWQEAIAEVKKDRPDFLFLAEAYWDLETRLCELGFDFAYDKKLYDFLVHDRPWDVQPHLLGLGKQNEKRAHFLENHDEPRAATAMPLDVHRAAALLIMSIPGMRFLNDGQLEGARRFARVQLGRRAVEAISDDVQTMYAQLLSALSASAVGKGVCDMLVPAAAWDDNPTNKCFNVIQWRHPTKEDAFDLVVVNLASHQAQCRVKLTVPGLIGGSWRMLDRLGTEEYVREGDDLVANGLFLDLPGRGAQVFSFTRQVPM